LEHRRLSLGPKIPVFAGVTRQKLILFHPLLFERFAQLFELSVSATLRLWPVFFPSGYHPMAPIWRPRSNISMPDRRIIRRHPDPRGAATVVALRGQHITAAEKERP
jgi:hypothetical protein